MRLIRELASHAKGLASLDWLRSLRVEPMNDSGMGSLQLVHEQLGSESSEFGSVLSAAQFLDADGVPVVASLYANKNGVPFELDLWKTNYSALIRIPETFQLLDE